MTIAVPECVNAGTFALSALVNVALLVGVPFLIVAIVLFVVVNRIDWEV